MEPILQTSLPYDPAAHRRLPGVQPLDPADWLQRDDAFAGQMALRDAYLADRRDRVIGSLPEAGAALDELLETVLDALRADQGYSVGEGEVARPDGVTVPLARHDPLGTLGRLVQEDLCLLQKTGAEHVLTAAVLCFPSSWTLTEKLGHPLVRIHRPVASYDEDIAKRVQRLFDGVKAGRPLWRYNHLPYASADLFQPRRESDPRDPARQGNVPMRYLRSERQSILRLPLSGAVVFSIHTYVLERD